MMDIGGDDGTAARDFALQQLRGEFFAFGDVGHLLAEDASAGQVHLGHVSGAIAIGLFPFALFDPGVTECHKSP